MSDISDVLTVLVNAAAAVIYPDGAKQPSITGTDIVIYPGWPASDNLDSDLALGKTHLSVFPKPDERNTTRYPEKYFVTQKPVPTLTLTVATQSGGHLGLQGGGDLLLEGGGSLLLQANASSITVGGTPSIPQNVMLRINGRDYVYAVQSNDTLNSIASKLAALIAADISGTTATGAVISLGQDTAGHLGLLGGGELLLQGGGSLLLEITPRIGRVQAARVGGVGTVAREIRRQERLVMLTVWAPTPALRDQIAAAVDVSLADQHFIAMPDGFGARVIYKNSPVVDMLQKATVYRRDLNYSIEYATTKSKQAAAVIAPILAVKTGKNQIYSVTF